MSKTKKILYLILCILILTILIPILLDYHKVSGLGLHLVDWKQISFLDFYLSRYVFWGTLVLSAVVLFLMLVTLFYPKQYLEIQKLMLMVKLTKKKLIINNQILPPQLIKNIIANIKKKLNTINNQILMLKKRQMLLKCNKKK